VKGSVSVDACAVFTLVINCAFVNVAAESAVITFVAKFTIAANEAAVGVGTEFIAITVVNA